MSELLQNGHRWKPTQILLSQALKIIKACNGEPKDQKNWTQYHYEVATYHANRKLPRPIPPEPVRFATTRSVQPVTASRTTGLFEPHRELGEVYLPSALLRADYGVVPFEHRRDVLARLMAWANSTEPVSSLLITAPGGQGKTRLAIRLCEVLRARGWLAGFLAHDLPKGLFGTDGVLMPRTLLVIDYAEGRTGQVVAAVEAMGGLERGRVLLLSRSAGSWWEGINDTDDEMAAAVLAGTTETALRPLVVAGDRSAEFSRAAEEFAHRLNVPASTVPIPDDLDDPRYETALDIHAAALAGVLDQVEPDARRPDRTDPVKRVLRHEKKYWDRTIRQYELKDAHRGRLHQVVAAGTLFGAADRASALHILGALPTFADQPPDVIDQFVRWSAAVYQGNGLLNGMRPDRLGEDHVAKTLEYWPELATAAIAVSDPNQARNALTVLGRAASRYAHVAETLPAIIETMPARLIPLGVDVAPRLEHPRQLVAALRAVLQQDPQSGILDAIHAALLPEGANPADLNITAFALLNEVFEQNIEREPENAALLLLQGSYSMVCEGQVTKALYTAPRAYSLFMDLATRNRHKYLPELMISCLILAIVDNADRQPEQARAGFGRARTLCQELIEAGTQAQLADLADLLEALALSLNEFGHFEEGLTVYQEAIALRRALAEVQPEQQRHVLAASLNQFSCVLVKADRVHEGHEAVTEAARIMMGLAENSSLLSLSYFSGGLLINWTNSLNRVGQPENALLLLDNALRVLDLLTTLDSCGNTPALVEALTTKSAILAGTDNFEDGLAAANKAVEIIRLGMAECSDQYDPYLAAALATLSDRLAEVARVDEAITAAEEVVKLYKELADGHSGDLAMAQRSLAVKLSLTNRLQDSVDHSATAISIYHELAAKRPLVYNRLLASVLRERAGVLRQLNRTDEADEAVLEARSLEDGDNSAVFRSFDQRRS